MSVALLPLEAKFQATVSASCKLSTSFAYLEVNKVHGNVTRTKHP